MNILIDLGSILLGLLFGIIFPLLWIGFLSFLVGFGIKSAIDLLSD